MNDVSGNLEEVPIEVVDWLTSLSESLMTDSGVPGVLAMPSGEKARVKHLFPDGYAAYLRLFHPFFHHPMNHAWPGDTPRITWKELAEQARVKYGPTVTFDQLRPVRPVK